MAHINSDILRLGVDVGSTTVKAVALDPADNSVLFTRYQRHNAHQADTVRQLLEEAAGHFPGMRFRIGVCGSGGRPIAAALGACYDIQPLLIQGAERADIALSTFHAIAKQTIGGLSQGLELTAPIIFEGGPLTFNPTLVRVFAERLNLEERDIVRPDHPETIVARGTAIAIDELFPGQEDAMTRPRPKGPPAPAGPSLPATRSGRSFSAATGRSCASRWMPRSGRSCGGTSASTPALPPPSSSL